MSASGHQRRSQGVESTKTVILYMLNLICMVLMSILVVGVLIISLIIYLEGSLQVDKMIFVHLTIPVFVLVLNLYVIMLEDHEEELFFKSSKKTGTTGRGVIFVNLALVASVISLTLAAYFKFVLGSGSSNDMQSQVIYQDESNNIEYEDGGFMGAQPETVVFIEECIMHALAVLESVSLREYAKAKLKDLVGARK
jgi:hypothetical protein